MCLVWIYYYDKAIWRKIYYSRHWYRWNIQYIWWCSHAVPPQFLDWNWYQNFSVCHLDNLTKHGLGLGRHKIILVVGVHTWHVKCCFEHHIISHFCPRTRLKETGLNWDQIGPMKSHRQARLWVEIHFCWNRHLNATWLFWNFDLMYFFLLFSDGPNIKCRKTGRKCQITHPFKYS